MVEETRVRIKRNIPALVAQGYKQVSRKYRMVAGLPEGKTGLEALKEADPEKYADLMTRVEEMAADRYRTYCADKNGHRLTLTWEEFNEFLTLTGRKPLPLELIKEQAIANGTYDPRWDNTNGEPQ